MGQHERLEGLAQLGRCTSLKRWFYGVREHLIYTPHGYIARVLQLPGNRHDVQGLYALLKTRFAGTLLGDNAYSPNGKKNIELRAHGITVHAERRCDSRLPHDPDFARWLHTQRISIENRISGFDAQFHADRTLNRSPRHYQARRWTKALANNCSRQINHARSFPLASYGHFQVAC